MSSVVISGDTSGTVTVTVPVVAGTNTVTIPAVTGNVITTGDSGTITQGMLATAASSIGVGQTWQAPSRAAGTTYTNSTGKPIMVAISYTNSTASSVQGLTINGLTVYCAGSEIGNGSGFSLIVPNGATYVTLTNSGVMTLVSWVELR